jgi:hypothetical protein
MPDNKPSKAPVLSRARAAIGRALLRAVPQGVKKRLDDRLFYAIFHLTRGTNDHYPQSPQPSRPEEDTQPNPQTPGEST